MTRTHGLGWCMATLLVACGGNEDAAGSDADTDTGFTTGADTDAVDETSASTTAGETEAEDESGDETGETEPEVELEVLSPPEHLIRISMALRGTRPSTEDLAAIEADPDRMPEFVDAYMQGDGFAEVVRDLHNDALLTRVEGALPNYAPLEDVRPQRIADSVTATALKLAELVVLDDRPYTELVTGDTWMVDDVVAAVYGITDGGSGWREVPIPGDRPAAGILSDNAFYLRHESAGANFHRGRANAVSTAFLCFDYEDNNIELDDNIDLTDAEAVAMALTTNPACQACHETLDPLASHFFPLPGNVMNNDIPSYPVPDLYRPANADDWQQTTGRAPGYFGQETSDIGELGQAIAEDPRFTACAARRFYAYFLQRRLDEVDGDTVDALEATFQDSGLQARALIRAIMLSDDFRVAGAASAEGADEVQGYLRARPFQLALLLEDLTGFRWEIDPTLIDPGQGEGIIDLSRSAAVGFAVLGGGGDSFTVIESAHTMNATTSLFIRQLASEAASYVVEHDLREGEGALLTLGDAVDEASVREQLASLFFRLYGEAVESNGPDVDDAYALFAALHGASGDHERAWKATLAALLQDFSITFY
ncbi:MAG: DUF1585 domain-containing protein [Myxococcota bacterium]